MALTFTRRTGATVRVDGAGTDENLPSVAAYGSTAEWAASGHVLGVGELGLDTTTGEMRAGNGSSAWASLSNVLSGTYAPVDPVTRYGAVGDGTADCTAAFQAAADALGPSGGTIFVPPGTYMISGPVNLKGASLRGASRITSLVKAVAGVSDATWKHGTATNDTAMFYGKNKSNWAVEDLGFDAQWNYVSCVAVVGGDNVRLMRNRVVNAGKCGLQFLGARYSGDLPVTNSTMQGNHITYAIWPLVADGTCLDCSIIGNTTERAVSRHISMDPGEAGLQDGSGTQRGMVVVGNTCRGVDTAPVGATLAGIVPDAMLFTNAPTWFGTIVGNSFHNWSTVGHGMRLRAARGTVSGNLLLNDGTGGNRGANCFNLDFCDGLTIDGNIGLKWTNAVWLDNTVSQTQVIGNKFMDILTSKYSLNGGVSLTTNQIVLALNHHPGTSGGNFEGGRMVAASVTAATTPGSVINKVQIFDANGTSLGFVPIYNTIT